MKIYHTLHPVNEKLSLAIGSFDGMHIAHKHVIENTKSTENAKLGVLMLINTPKVSNLEIPRLLSKEETITKAKEFGVDILYMIPFSSSLKNIEPHDFINILCNQLHVISIGVGYNFRFGKGAIGDVKWLEDHKKETGYMLNITDKIKIDNKVVSSTNIRNSLKKGELESANMMLGYNFFVNIAVKHGDKKGRTMNIETANGFDKKLNLLKQGVYITKTTIDNASYKSASNWGVKPTFKNKEPVLETHILDFKGDLYGKNIKIEFLSFLREEIEFKNALELKKQIINDIEIIKNYS